MKRLETIINIVTVVALVTAGGIAAKRYFSKPQQNTIALAHSLANVDFKKAPRTVVMVVQRGCDCAPIVLPFPKW